MNIKKLSLFTTILLTVVFLFASCAFLSKNPDSNDNDNSDTKTNTSTATNTNASCKHVYGEWTLEVEPKCAKQGEEHATCTLCGHIGVKYIAALGHTEEIVPAVEATCVSTGLTQGKKCSVCNAILIAQKIINKNNNHKYDEFVDLVITPSLNQEGLATYRCTECKGTTDKKIPAMTVNRITKDDIYKIETNNIYNPAIDNIWKMFDGNKDSVGIYAQGADWFGDVGDTLIVTLDQEILLKELYVYVAGNWTTANVTVKNANGSALVRKQVRAEDSSYGGPGTKVEIFKGEKAGVYIIEVQITSIKESYQTFKLTEIEVFGAKQDKSIIGLDTNHIHDYREFYKEITPATCVARGTATYKCYCGAEGDYYTPKLEREFTQLVSYTAPTCEEGGQAVYNCTCGSYKRTVDLPPLGHNYQRLVSYIDHPTESSEGRATYKCINCDLTEERVILALSLSEIKYLRVVELNGAQVKVRFNIDKAPVAYDIRYSTSEITEESFDSATQLDFTLTGNKELTATFDLDASIDKCYYVAVRPYSGENNGKVSCVRVGGDMLLPIDYSNANVYHGEILSSFAKMFDEQNGINSTPTTVLPRNFNNANDTVYYNLRLAPIVDLETLHHVSSVYLYYADAGTNVTVRWADTPVDFLAEDDKWDGVYSFTTASGWNEIAIDSTTRYIQVVFQDGSAPYEMLVYGYQNGEGDTISTDDIALPSINEMMGMCGFAAIGTGNTPVDSVECTSILREYHNLGWSYVIDNFPNKSNVLSGSTMGDFEARYAEFKQAGIEVIPCIQWDLASQAMSNKIDENGMPIFDSTGKLVAGSYWDKFNPLTYYVYSDHMFAYAAKYGRNSSEALREVAGLHTTGSNPAVGLDLVNWIELGNEPDANWHGGIVSYYSAYQLAALNSACYDGHGSTLKSSISDTGYHFGIKNADPTMGVGMAGISAASNEYMTAMCYWMKANRPDGLVAFDAFNVHHYMSKPITVQTPNGEQTRYVGMSPEEADLQGVLSQLVEIRNKYYPEKEVWLTEFGWDTNQSYATVNSSHAYGEYTGRQVQAMWLTRAYLLLSASGVDKATMYMCEDISVEAEAVGKFGSSGVIAYEYDENGEKVEVKKDSYYYLYTLKNTLGSYTFDSEVEAYDENVMIYKFTNANGKTAYAVWCPTSDGTKVENYCLGIDAEGATLVENVYGLEEGQRSELEADELGYVKVNVSESPIYILVD